MVSDVETCLAYHIFVIPVLNTAETTTKSWLLARDGPPTSFTFQGPKGWNKAFRGMASGQKVVAVCGGPKEIDLPLGLGNAGEFHDGSMKFLDDYTHLYQKNGELSSHIYPLVN